MWVLCMTWLPGDFINIFVWHELKNGSTRKINQCLDKRQHQTIKLKKKVACLKLGTIPICGMNVFYFLSINWIIPIGPGWISGFFYFFRLGFDSNQPYFCQFTSSWTENTHCAMCSACTYLSFSVIRTITRGFFELPWPFQAIFHRIFDELIFIHQNDGVIISKKGALLS